MGCDLCGEPYSVDDRAWWRTSLSLVLRAEPHWMATTRELSISVCATCAEGILTGASEEAILRWLKHFQYDKMWDKRCQKCGTWTGGDTEKRFFGAVRGWKQRCPKCGEWV